MHAPCVSAQRMEQDGRNGTDRNHLNAVEYPNRLSRRLKRGNTNALDEMLKEPAIAKREHHF